MIKDYLVAITINSDETDKKIVELIALLENANRNVVKVELLEDSAPMTDEEWDLLVDNL